MHVLCAPDSFKGCLTARAVAEALAEGARRAGASVDICPVADGGEGTIDAVLGAIGGRVETREVPGPRGDSVAARFGLAQERRLAIVELAEASGLTLVSQGPSDPETASTRGAGLLIRAAIDTGAGRIIVGLGGSATVDGGVGLAQAAGAVFHDRDGRPIDTPLTGVDLPRIGGCTPPSRGPVLVAACDVASPLCGSAGAALVFGPQKGATIEQATRLDAELAALAERLGVDPDVPGYGAAGGAGFGMAVFLGAELRRGAELVLEMVGFEDRCARADLVLTGEGRLDTQTAAGKVVSAIARCSDVPVIAIVGEVHGAPPEGVTAVSLVEMFGQERALGQTTELLAAVAAEVVESM